MNPRNESRSVSVRTGNWLERDEKLKQIQSYKRKNQRSHPAFKTK